MEIKFTDIEKETPSDDCFGHDFLLKIQSPTTHEYEVAEWFNPNPDGVIDDEDVLPFFNIRITSPPYTRKIIGWAQITKNQ